MDQKDDLNRVEEIEEVSESETPLPTVDEMIKQIRLTGEIVWKKNLSKENIDEWLSNFKGEVFDKDYEDKLALWLLANFVYYNEEEVRHLCCTLYRDFIHSVMSSKTPIDNIEKEYKELLRKCRFYSLGKPGESSAYVLYYFRQVNNLPVKKFISDLNHLDKDVDTIVFVEDVVLSEGEKKCQAETYINDLKNKYEILKQKNILILSFIASTDAINYLKGKGINIINCITLDERHKCFTTSSIVFSYFKDHLANAKQFAEHYGSKIKPHNPLGHNDGQFLFGFFYNTPDNTLPIFWAEENDWVPIRKRYHKNYHNNLIDLGKFI